MKFIIYEDQWAYGRNIRQVGNLTLSPPNYLCDTATEKKCCLGFYSLALGIPLEKIWGLADPQDVVNWDESIQYPVELLTIVKDPKTGDLDAQPTDLCIDLINVNDVEQGEASSYLELGREGIYPCVVNSYEERKELIVRLFAKMDVEVEFVAESPAA